MRVGARSFKLFESVPSREQTDSERFRSPSCRLVPDAIADHED